MSARMWVVALAVVLTAASTLVPGTAWRRSADTMGCEAGCTRAAAGWPAPFVADGFVTSPQGRATLLGAIFGMDDWIPGPLLASFACWLAVSAGGAVLLRRVPTLPRR